MCAHLLIARSHMRLEDSHNAPLTRNQFGKPAPENADLKRAPANPSVGQNVWRALERGLRRIFGHIPGTDSSSR